jgi:hypothetical protein
MVIHLLGAGADCGGITTYVNEQLRLNPTDKIVVADFKLNPKAWHPRLHFETENLEVFNREIQTTGEPLYIHSLPAKTAPLEQRQAFLRVLDRPGEVVFYCHSHHRDSMRAFWGLKEVLNRADRLVVHNRLNDLTTYCISIKNLPVSELSITLPLEPIDKPKLNLWISSSRAVGWKGGKTLPGLWGDHCKGRRGFIGVNQRTALWRAYNPYSGDLNFNPDVTRPKLFDWLPRSDYLDIMASSQVSLVLTKNPDPKTPEYSHIESVICKTIPIFSVDYRALWPDLKAVWFELGDIEAQLEPLLSTADGVHKFNLDYLSSH